MSGPVPRGAPRFLGDIASPAMSASPIKAVQDLWGGELPPFDTIDEANELIGALVMGLWNRLTRHQDRGSPFRMMRIAVSTNSVRCARCSRRYCSLPGTGSSKPTRDDAATDARANEDRGA